VTHGPFRRTCLCDRWWSNTIGDMTDIVNNKRRIGQRICASLSALLGSLFILSGCFRQEIVTSLSEQGNITGTLLIAYDKQALADNGADLSTIRKNIARSVKKKLPKGVSDSTTPRKSGSASSTR
jgi:hypothetical protein